jgi:p-aminobenzoyl-glutamate transporter AbgT
VASAAGTAPQPRCTGPIGLVSSVSSACAAIALASAAWTAEVTIGVPITMACGVPPRLCT